ncbi:elongation factor Ts [Candidatus Parcubacteria bacterium]|uniref:Elongation factor Ts n=1 Tax=Candidatus Kaiserbacteria bacterium CG10_big_fil_rev_8_21_14_0_10_47_16 TaxID=1974608 RepID=A0A2H0UFX6_9BACT|nr:elongation factor Ts [Candidatus Parcubacteria bacterium]PIR84705.1 MAG: elongation factor Ts [Candidatus Kaiserbacteria bacterium CG10_big_fil_rev_8_21_14_0_10_47_16]
MEITSAQLKELRDKTGISVMQCKKALEEAGGDMEKALIILQKKGGEAASKKSDRELGSGTIGSYVHNTGEVAALVNLACETDFVAKNEEFIKLARDIAMHVAAQAPLYVTREDVDETALTKAREVFKVEVADKPADMQEKILEGKLSAYFKDRILLEQPFIKDSEKTISDLINNAVQKFGENIAIAEVRRVSVK